MKNVDLRRLRLAFLAVAIFVLIPLGFLVRRSLASANAEQNAAQRTLAERIFDEIERDLTEVLTREEERPFEHYRADYLDPTTGLQTPSPLAAPPAEDYVLGYFQVAPDGTLTGPEPGAAARLAPTLRGLWRSSEKLKEETADTISEKLSRLQSQAIGSTLEVKSPQSQDLAKKKQARGSYLDSFNRAAQERETRIGKSEQTRRSNVLQQADIASRSADAEAAKETERLTGALELAESDSDADANAGAKAEEARARARPEEPLLRAEEEAFDDALADVLSEEIVGADESRQAPIEELVVDLRLEPMVGRLADDGRLVLYRTVTVDSQAFRQGLVIEPPALIRRLARVVERSPAGAGARLYPVDDEDAAIAAVEYGYRRRFAEPFGEIGAVLTLSALPDFAATRSIYALSLLLAAATFGGLLAVYRMVSVTVEFARRRNNFVSAVTHELKTPLTAIRMYGEMLRDDVVPDESKRRRYYETITSECERLSRLLDNVLELARLEKDAHPMNPRVGPVDEVLEETVRILQPHAQEKGFALRVEIEPDLAPARYDRDALLQVLVNLVDNALKYAASAEVKEIVLRAQRRGDDVALSVVDHGPGVDRAQLKKIFEPFYRAEDELTRTAQGTGIGLSLVRSLVERMGGRVWGENRPEGGFAVRIALATSSP